MRDDRQLRTDNDKALLGYRARINGENVIAIMKGKECRIDMVKTGPYIDLEKLIS